MKQSRKVGKKIIDEVEVQIQQLLQLRESLNQTTLQKRDEVGLASEEEQKRAPKDEINILVSDDDDGNNDDKAAHAVVADDDKEF